MSLFTMLVLDTFHLEDGRTVFIGPVETDAKTIPPCDCEIIVGSESKATFRLDGEEIAEGKRTPNRAVSTRQEVDLAKYDVGRGGYTIRSKD